MLMKNLIWLLASLFVLVLSSCKSTEVSTKEPEPSDYWLLKRSHPEFGFDQEAYRKGIAQVNDLKKNKSGGPELNLNWEQEGPFAIGGRINCVTPLFPSSDTIFCGTANGGVFRTYDGGQNWVPVFDDHAYMAIGAITVDPSDHNRIFVATGDRNFGGSSYNGNGIYRSDDLGNNWTNIGLTDAGIIGSLIVDDENADHLLAGALGFGHGKTTNRGVYRSTDGGATWTNTLFVSDSSGVCEMVADPTNDSTVYACFFNRLNLADRSIAKGPDSKIYKSIDQGATWVQLTNGLPNVENSRVGIAVAPTNPNRVYALYVGTDYNIYGLYRSDDAGASWNSVPIDFSGLGAGALGGFGWYFGRVHVDPYNQDHVIIPGVDQFESFDAGINWTENVPPWFTYEVHADKHSLYFSGPNSIIIGTDGGMYKTTDGGANWSPLGELPITQFYRVEATTFNTGEYAGGAQDNGSTSGNAATPWSRDFGGDGFQMTYISPSTNRVIYETQRGGIFWTDDVFGSENMDVNLIDPNENTNWNTPYIYFRDDQDIMAGTNRLIMRFAPPNDPWVAVSGDLTLSGMGMAPVDRYHTITELEYNTTWNDDEVLVGTSDGLVWRGDKYGAMNNWVNIKGNLPDNYVTSVNFSKRVQDKLYVTMSGYYTGFTQALVFKSEDHGATWTDISSNLPAIGVNDMVTYDRDNNEFLFIGTDAGVFVSDDDGVSWDLLGTGLPTVTVDAIDIDETTQRIIAGTYGRSMWSYDISWALGLEEIEASEMLIYPNPASEILDMSRLHGTTIIRDVNGKVLYEGTDNQIDVSNWSNGNYFVQNNGRVAQISIVH